MFRDILKFIVCFYPDVEDINGFSTTKSTTVSPLGLACPSEGGKVQN